MADNLPTALVIEDDPSIAMLLQFLLQRAGYDTQVLEDGRAANALITPEAPPHLVILDIMLPYVDGIELLRQMREQASWKDTIIIMLTTKSHESDIVRALELGANDYVVKPFQPNEVLARIRRHVKTA